MSLRAVESGLRHAAPWLAAHNAELIAPPRQAVYVDATDVVKEKLRDHIHDLRAGERVWAAEDRWKVLAFYLLTDHGPTTIRQLQSRLRVSRPTLIADMDAAEAWLARFEVLLVRRPGYGVAIQGEERRIREATQVVLLDNTSEGYIQSLVDDVERSIPCPVSLCFESCADVAAYLANLNLSSAGRYLRQLESHLSIRLTDTCRFFLALMLGIAILRLKSGHVIRSLSTDRNDIGDTPQYREARMLANLIGRESGLIVPEVEASYIALCLLGAKIMPSGLGPEESPSVVGMTEEALDITRDFLSEVSLHLHPIIRIDRRLMRNLAFHIKPVLTRLRYGLPIRNPLLEAIRAEYPFLFRLVRQCSGAIRSATGAPVPDEEIGYLVMHLAAAMRRVSPITRLGNRALLVCGAGVATIWLIVSRLNRALPGIEIKDVLSASEVRRRKSYSDFADFVVSTVPLVGLDLPVIEVSPFLTEDDIGRISAMLDHQRPSDIDVVTPERSGPSLSELLTARSVELNIRARNWPEVVDRAGGILLATGAIEQDYVKAMYEMIRAYGPYAVIQPGVVLLHARPKQGVNRVCMALATLAKPIEFGHPCFDPVDVAFVMGSTNEFEHINALDQLACLLEDEHKLDGIRRSTSRPEVLQIIRDHVVALGNRYQT